MDSSPPPPGSVQEPTPLSDAEKIRLKRLAKLQQGNTNTSSETSQPTASSSKTVPTRPNSLPKTPTQEKPASPIKKPSTPVNQELPEKTPPKITPPTKSFEDWQNDIISRVLQITLDKSTAEKSENRLIYLDSVVKTLMEENPGMVSFKLSKSVLDSALFARLSIDPNQMSDGDQPPQIPLFDYLLDSWKRASEIKRSIRASKTLEQSVINERVGVIDTLKELIINYVQYVLLYPDDLPQIRNSVELGPNQFVSRLLAEFDSSEGLPLDFIKELVNKVDDEGFDKLFAPALLGYSAQIRTKNILGMDYLLPLNSLVTLSEIKPLADKITKLRNWNSPNSTARIFEVGSLLGPFCKFSVFPTDEPKIAESYFANPHTRRQADIDSAMTSLRGAIRGVQQSVFKIFNNIVRSSPSAREAVLSYFAEAIKLNERRAQMQVDPFQVGSDGFLMNLTSVLLYFADPIMDMRNPKIDRIDVNYFCKSNRIDISRETKIKATQQEADTYFSSVDESASAPNFISEIFFLTIAMHHYGPLHSYEVYNNFIRDILELQKQYDRMRADQPNWAGTPMAARNEELLAHCKTQLEKYASHRIAYETQLLDQVYLDHSLKFYNLVMNWMLRIVDPTGKHPEKQIQLPLPPTPPETFAMLPEYIFEDVAEIFLFVAKYIPRAAAVSRDDLIVFIITFLKSSSYIKKPYLKAKLVEILFYFTFRSNDREVGMVTAMNSHPLALNHLLSALMSFYVEVEQTGAHTQFYDKFNIRYNISQIFKAIWGNHVHKEKLREESRNIDSFVRFANLLMNDVTFLLDESLRKLAEIHSIQTEMDNKDEWESQTQQYRQERENTLRSDERSATSYISLGNETVEMLVHMTSEVADPFLTPQMVERLAAMLDYNLKSLVGPKCTELKVRNPETYSFKPKELLSQLVKIYLNLCKRKEFVYAVARDKRSYDKKYFSKAASILSNKGLFSQKNVSELEKFVNEVEETIKSENEDEEELGEVPDEFLDPVLYTIMEDPVILPGSRTTVDRSTIITHLLSDTTDPFNRMPLKIEDVIPNTELKERIEKFRQEKRRK
ncbi:Ubiquitin conjugation factor E4 [Gigaspora margarita]|uniref:RING-type E3 ubiquitin transferase n=1 Tax=Gigaspora margarita TaxID=4874 RepID=A0A8H4EPK8_GIGMA|nr:Ubiquitin conjugation factor E4 [Gigaspora margarita]